MGPDVSTSASTEPLISFPDSAEGLADFYPILRDSLDEKAGCSDISTIPNELLLAIFSQYLTLNLHRGYGSQPCITLTSICRRWRNLGLGTSSLWKYITITPRSKKAWVKTQLSRSSQHPLVVYAASSSTSRRCRTVVGLLNLVLTEMHRISDIQLLLPSLGFSDIKYDLLRAAPILRRVRFGIVGWAHGLPVPLDISFPVLEGIELDLPTLQSVRPTLRPSIRRLTIEISKDYSGLIPVIPGNFMAALAGMGSVESFSFTSDIPYSSPFRGVGQHVAFPRLRRLSLLGHCEVLNWMIDHLTFPSTTSIKIFCHCKSGVPVGCYSAFGQRISSSFIGQSSGADSPKLLGLSMLTEWLSRAKEVHLQGWTAPYIAPLDPSVSSPTPLLDFSMAPRPHEIYAFQEVYFALPLASIQILCLGRVASLFVASASNSPLINTFRRMEGLRTLVLSGWHEYEVCDTLEATVACVEDPAARSLAAVVFPVLESLVLRRITFGTSNTTKSLPAERRLLYGLRSRGTYHTPIRLLVLEGLKIFDGFDIGLLQREVQVLEIR